MFSQNNLKTCGHLILIVDFPFYCLYKSTLNAVVCYIDMAGEQAQTGLSPFSIMFTTRLIYRGTSTGNMVYVIQECKQVYACACQCDIVASLGLLFSEIILKYSPNVRFYTGILIMLCLCHLKILRLYVKACCFPEIYCKFNCMITPLCMWRLIL